jgi:Phage tail assembly chaperone proteins, E, or 41 or 14
MAAKDFVKFEDGKAVITLAKPANLNGTKVPSLTMREPTVKDQLIFEATPGSNADKEIAVMASLTGLVPDDITSLTLRDYSRLQAAYAGFTD